MRNAVSDLQPLFRQALKLIFETVLPFGRTARTTRIRKAKKYFTSVRVRPLWEQAELLVRGGKTGQIYRWTL